MSGADTSFFIKHIMNTFASLVINKVLKGVSHSLMSQLTVKDFKQILP